jgi:hypothetical protein
MKCAKVGDSTLTFRIRVKWLDLDGYEIEHDGLCTTVFSAPNYVDQGGNKGAFVRLLFLHPFLCLTVLRYGLTPLVLKNIRNLTRSLTLQ